MEKTKVNVPKLRFPGVAGEWEERKLSEISDVRDGTHDSPSYLSKGHPFVTSKNVKDGYINYDDIQYISDEDFEAINKRSRVEINDILMGMIGTIGNLALIRTEPDFAIKNVALIKNTKQVSYLYLYHYLQSPSAERQLLSGLDGGTQKFISLKNIRELTVMVPSEAEQLKVGTFIESLDNLITLHHRKLDQIKEYKKGMLQKMFPKHGETVPEIRFPGFTGAWEQRKVGDLFTFVKQKNSDNAVNNVITNSAEYGLIPQRDFFDKDIAVEGHTNNYTVIQKGDFVYNPRKSTTAPYGPFNCYTLEEKGIVSPLYTCLSLTTNDCTEYLLWYFKTDKWYSYIQLNGAQGGARHDRVGMTNELMNGIPVSLPSYEEQKNIAAFLTSLEQAITLHQHKLEQMKEYKKGLLQQMFV